LRIIHRARGEGASLHGATVCPFQRGVQRACHLERFCGLQELPAGQQRDTNVVACGARATDGCERIGRGDAIALDPIGESEIVVRRRQIGFRAERLRYSIGLQNYVTAVGFTSHLPMQDFGWNGEVRLEGGNPWRGAEEFFGNAVLPCARCHRVGGDGGEAGPALTRIGAQHPPEYLLESVVKPSAHIAPGFDLVTFTLNDGSTESGSVVSESATGIVIKRGDGTQATLDPGKVKQRVTAPSSMPEIYGQMLTRTQLRDVVAFLKAQDGSRSQQGGAEEGLGVSNRAMQSAPKEGAAGGHP